ncbi:LytTR family DNA-binding domain-containing protein [Roseicyclus persicicus]|uniref:LytTR family transcriptional regulator n=1 Tax=Roseicyclus persicicus TaxID=2650661 RepID=A0A7X6GYT6_9RHOB|nr:LytTR family DNA-binding domain-containing protein [Roseibacterium persicicum]NKX44179.1 LytTR family transcriptional regulator [Roseibacterium persicicum]
MIRSDEPMVSDIRGRVLSRLVAWLAATVVVALIGPFTTYLSFTFAERLAYWGTLIGGAILVAEAVRAVTGRVFGDESLSSDLAGALVLALVLGPAIWAVNLLLYGFDVAGLFWLAEHVVVVLAVCLCIVLVRDQLRRSRDRAAARQPAPPAPMPDVELSAPVPEPERRPGFLDRVEGVPEGRLLRVSADDHYLHVVTTAGCGRILMRFRDALEELEALPGHRIHRSHWVAEGAILRIRAEGRRHLAELGDGTALPVSRAYLDDLRAAGLLG